MAWNSSTLIESLRALPYLLGLGLTVSATSVLFSHLIVAVGTNSPGALGLLALEVACYLFLHAVMVRAVVDLNERKRPVVRSIFLIVFQKFSLLVVSYIRFLAIVFALFITVLGIPFAVNRAIRWTFVTQAIVIDDVESAGAALERSAEVVKGHWWLLLAVVAAYISVSIVYPLGVELAGQDLSLPIQFGVTAIIAPLFALATTLLYLSLSSSRLAGGSSSS